MKDKTIVVKDIRVEDRNGTDILVVESGNMNQYTTPDPYLVNKFRTLSEEQEDRYIGVQWRIAFSLVTRDGREYNDFEGFLSKALDNKDSTEGLEDRLGQLEDVVARLENEVRKLREGESSD